VAIGYAVSRLQDNKQFSFKGLKGHIQRLFTSIVLMLAEMGVIDIKEIAYTDGTKIEANANKNTFVWEGSVKYHKEKLEARLKKVLAEIDAQIKEDSKYQNTQSYDEQKIDKEVLNKKIEEINNKLKENRKLPPRQKQKIEKKLENIKKKTFPD
jgi:hypothetical protein